MAAGRARGLLGAAGHPLDRGLGLLGRLGGGAHLVGEGAQLVVAAGAVEPGAAQARQLLAKVAQHQAGLFVAHRLHLRLLDAGAQRLHERARLAQLGAQAGLARGALGQLLGPPAQLVQLAAQPQLVAGALALGGQPVLQRLQLPARLGQLAGQAAALLVAGPLKLSQLLAGGLELGLHALELGRARSGQLLEPPARARQLHLQVLALLGA